MSWQCRLIEYQKGMDLQIGDMFWGPTKEQYLADPLNYGWLYFFSKLNNLSEYYKQNNSHRRPLLVWLPGRNLFCVDGMCWNSEGKYGGWTVTGDAPVITVHPSINLVGSYHGWLQSGVISNDVEGRTFDETDGGRLR